jgi:hypothetical protein
VIAALVRATWCKTIKPQSEKVESNKVQGCKRTLEAIALDGALATAFGSFNTAFGAGLEAHEIVPKRASVLTGYAFCVLNDDVLVPFDAATCAQKVPSVTRTARCKGVRHPLRVRRALQVADSSRATALARELVFLGAANDDGTALALRSGQGGTDELGREVL